MHNKKINQIARKKKICDINSAKFIKKTDWESNHIIINNEKIYKLNIKGILVTKIEKKNTIECVIDDGTATILVRIFSPKKLLIETLNVGVPVNVIGRISEFNNEKYINAIAVKKINFNWLTFHKKEIKLFGETSDKKETSNQNQKKEPIKSMKEIGEEDLNYEIIDFVNNKDKGSGVFIEDIITQFQRFGRENIEKIAEYLLKNGHVFEYRKNYFKVL